MTRTELKQLLARIGVRPSRKLGQNFLVDHNLLAALVREAAPRPGEHILEIGAGTGILTTALLSAGCRVTAVEYDHRLAAYLRDTFGQYDAFALIEEDVCDLDFDRIIRTSGAFRCVSNLPYAVSSAVVGAFAAMPEPPRELCVLLQLEMAQRLAAQPGTKAYGALTVRMAQAYAVRIVRRVPPTVFYPPPDIGSAYVHAVRRENLPATNVRRSVARLTSIGFGQRRKRLAKLLAAEFGRAAVQIAFAQCAITNDVRAENLTPEQFLALAVLV